MILAPVSVGELVDKITILEIKLDNISDPAKLENISKEHDILVEVLGKSGAKVPMYLQGLLKVTNEKLWDIEDALRKIEKSGLFNKEVQWPSQHKVFIELARDVYKLNDARSDLKRQINEATGSELIEEKSYV